MTLSREVLNKGGTSLGSLDGIGPNRHFHGLDDFIVISKGSVLEANMVASEVRG